MRLSPTRIIGAAIVAVAVPLSHDRLRGGSTPGDTIVIGTKFDQPGLRARRTRTGR